MEVNREKETEGEKEREKEGACRLLNVNSRLGVY